LLVIQVGLFYFFSFCCSKLYVGYRYFASFPSIDPISSYVILFGALYPLALS
jgi:hypothetical protein